MKKSIHTIFILTVSIVFLSSCEPEFGNEQTNVTVVDARYFDAPPHHGFAETHILFYNDGRDPARDIRYEYRIYRNGILIELQRNVIGIMHGWSELERRFILTTVDTHYDYDHAELQIFWEDYDGFSYTRTFPL